MWRERLACPGHATRRWWRSVGSRSRYARSPRLTRAGTRGGFRFPVHRGSSAPIRAEVAPARGRGVPGSGGSAPASVCPRHPLRIGTTGSAGVRSCPAITRLPSRTAGEPPAPSRRGGAGEHVPAPDPDRHSRSVDTSVLPSGRWRRAGALLHARRLSHRPRSLSGNRHEVVKGGREIRRIRRGCHGNPSGSTRVSRDPRRTTRIAARMRRVELVVLAAKEMPRHGHRRIGRDRRGRTLPDGPPAHPRSAGGSRRPARAGRRRARAAGGGPPGPAAAAGPDVILLSPPRPAAGRRGPRSARGGARRPRGGAP